jgi:nitroreductase
MVFHRLAVDPRLEIKPEACQDRPMAENILSQVTSVPKIKHHEPAPPCDIEAFKTIVKSRRSVRVFDSTPIPDSIVNDCIDLALLAPNSSNLQPWEFHWIRTPELKTKIAEACLGQNAATTAQAIIVCVARTTTWRKHAKMMVGELEKVSKGQPIPKIVRVYYEKLSPIVYTQGILSLFGRLKSIVYFFRGLKEATPREPASLHDMDVWAVKSTSLACENLMLAFRAYGFDSCPMEGFDSRRVRKLLKLPSDALIPMIIGAGRRAPNGVYGPQVRFDRNLFVFER